MTTLPTSPSAPAFRPLLVVPGAWDAGGTALLMFTPRIDPVNAENSTISVVFRGGCDGIVFMRVTSRLFWSRTGDDGGWQEWSLRNDPTDS
ncbi:hypothetical protein GCM10007304_29040 [Rhodococcoides trifolii]|uniref:Uncharacterized protein n=1 Tax=Rhodococcoides trifolii TaxID=908250 RepID=A0A917D631_9NOCA|nr:hypothetical protein GCM10007304_29040 [Rhodococcus trifolii]